MQDRETEYRIRKLTPRECWRLMDFKDEDFDKAAEVNSIVCNVLVAIMGQMFDGKEDYYKDILTKNTPYK